MACSLAPSPSSITLTPALWAALLVAACGDAGGAGASSTGSPPPTTGTTAPIPTTGEPTSTTGDATSGSGSQGVTGDASTAAVTSTTTEGPKFDLGEMPDAGRGVCTGQGMGMGDPEFSYIWIANTVQGTITKLDTQTMVEQGRYQTRPDINGSPSRTSVNLSGDVAVANRNGGVTKVYARVDDCQDTNGTPGIQTSSGKDDILAWGQEECVAWHTPFAYTTQRPVAWTAGVLNVATCKYEGQKLWTAGADAQAQMNIDVVLLNGDDGSIEATIPVPVAVAGFGAYGGAVDAEGDFWFMTYTNSFPLVEVDLEDHTYQIYTPPPELHPYGITIDRKGRVWFGADLGGTARFDPATMTWNSLPGVTGLGIQEHPDGYMWMGTWPTTGIQAIDTETMALGPFIALPSPSQTKGVSIDFYGNVWLVDMTNSAWRIDPDTLEYEVYTGLDQPYTYSDMTGWGLSNVSNPQG
jgi:hypothetical protein